LVGIPLGVPMWALSQTTGLVPAGILKLFHDTLLMMTPVMAQTGVGVAVGVLVGVAVGVAVTVAIAVGGAVTVDVG